MKFYIKELILMAILTVKLFYAFPYMNDVDLHTQIVEHVRRKIEKMSIILDKT